ncbi:MAG TPA: hypothetical protein EYP21_10935 [Syntrophaceae bacterium]|nr:hypothetical protein [Syntrophaceae bacterium]
MSKKETIRIPKETFLEIMTYIPTKELDKILQEVKRLRKKRKIEKTRLIEPSDLDPLIGMVHLGGDAVKDTEEFYE